ncbi:RHS repeat-associated core domain-containing protein, partial [Salmonella bongori]|uniref:RHS repeat-associated core domain-containing protein n=4 Tax=Salmonella bongori TaxID=54736 RepID=UPI00241F4A0E
TDPAGNRVADREQYPALPPVWRDNRIGEDVQYFYHHDAHGRLAEKDERRIRDGGSHSHHYHYDNQHRLAHYRCEQQGVTLLESRYLYDPLGRRIGKRVWKSRRERGSLSGEEYIYLNKTPEVTWYGWDGDRLTTTETDTQRIQTIYLPGSFTPLVRIETETSELLKAVRRTLAEKFQQEANVTFPPELVVLVDSLEAELQRGELSEASRTWLAQCGLTPEQIQNQIEPEYIPERKIHLYHCDHRGLPLALVSHEGKVEWSAEYDAWGNVLSENNPHNLKQLIRLPGQQYDEETGLYYNRHRYYDPSQGRYITQDPIGLEGGWNLYTYSLNPVTGIDPLGLETCVINRDLAVFGDSARSRNNPVTHTFSVITDSNGDIIHTYSWGNDANLNGWNIDQQIDLKSARDALNSGKAECRSDIVDDKCVSAAFDILNKKENNHINGMVYFNCKTETTKLLDLAKKICDKWYPQPIFKVDFNGMFGR